MGAGQKVSTDVVSDTNDEKVRKDDELSQRGKTRRNEGPSLAGTGAGAGDSGHPINDRRETEGASRDQSEGDKSNKVDRPGFDLGGATNETTAGKGLGLGEDAKEDKKDWKLPR